MVLPNEPDKRKKVPVYSGFLAYFPRAVAEVAKLSVVGNDQHNPGDPLRWDRAKSGDEKDALARHLLEAGSLDSDGIRHSAKVAWRAMANLEKELEAAAALDNASTALVWDPILERWIAPPPNVHTQMRHLRRKDD